MNTQTITLQYLPCSLFFIRFVWRVKIKKFFIRSLFVIKVFNFRHGTSKVTTVRPIWLQLGMVSINSPRN